MIGKIEHLALNNITLCDDGTLQDDITGLKIELTKCVFFLEEMVQLLLIVVLQNCLFPILNLSSIYK